MGGWRLRWWRIWRGGRRWSRITQQEAQGGNPGLLKNRLEATGGGEKTTLARQLYPAATEMQPGPVKLDEKGLTMSNQWFRIHYGLIDDCRINQLSFSKTVSEWRAN